MIKKVTFGVKSYFFRTRWFYFKSSKPSKNIKKNFFSPFFRKIAYIPIFSTKIKMFFLRWDVNSPRNAGNGIIYAIFREKIELPLKVNIFLPFSIIFFQNMEMKWKHTEKSFFLKKYIFFHWNGLYYIEINRKWLKKWLFV